MAEYEVTLYDMKMSRGLGVENVTRHTDLQLVARQSTEEFIAKEPQIFKYVELLRELSNQFTCFQVEQILLF